MVYSDFFSHQCLSNRRFNFEDLSQFELSIVIVLWFFYLTTVDYLSESRPLLDFERTMMSLHKQRFVLQIIMVILYASLTHLLATVDLVTSVERNRNVNFISILCLGRWEVAW